MRIGSIGTCEAHGQCAMVDEDLFPLDDDGYTALPALGVDASGGVEVPGGKEGDARRGVDACPLQALALIGEG